MDNSIKHYNRIKAKKKKEKENHQRALDKICDGYFNINDTLMMHMLDVQEQALAERQK